MLYKRITVSAVYSIVLNPTYVKFLPQINDIVGAFAMPFFGSKEVEPLRLISKCLFEYNKFVK
jgi:hypothetical protein